MNILSISHQLLAFIIFVFFNLAALHGQVRADVGSKLTTQADLQKPQYVQGIEDFWEKYKQPGEFPSSGRVQKLDGKEEEIPDAAGIRIRYVKLLREDSAVEKGAIVISTGRTETYLKYKEVAFDLWNNGYSVYIIDHRGQGLSERERGLNDPEKGHVKDFGLFVSDFKQLVDKVKNDHQSLFLIAHSMGGAIASLYLEQYPDHPFRAVAFTSPMHEIQSSIVPGKSMWATCTLVGIPAFFSPDDYVIGGGPYGGKSLLHNEYTSDKIRYKRLLQLYIDEEGIQLGSPTHGWLDEACNGAESAIENSSRITIPVRLYEAGDDTIVHPDGHKEFCSNLPKNGQERCWSNGEPKVIPKAKHELLIEEDGKRNEVLSGILQFFEGSRNIARTSAARVSSPY